MTGDQSKLTRRTFLKYTAMTTAMTGAWHSTALKTDAKDPPDVKRTSLGPEPNPGPYTYTDSQD